MRQVTVISLKNQAIIADKCSVAESFLARLRGLMGKSKLDAGQGMLFPQCNDIHMWFMGMSLDVVFLALQSPRALGTENYRVTSLHENVRPWKALPLRDRQASETLELPPGVIRARQIAVGDSIQIRLSQTPGGSPDV